MSKLMRFLFYPFWRLSEQLRRMQERIECKIGKRIDNVEEQLRKMEARIMGTVKEFSDAVNAEFDKISAAVDGLVVDVKTLNDKIAELQNSAGTVTPADQALLDDIQSKAANIANKVGALDAQTEAPPAPPTE